MAENFKVNFTYNQKKIFLGDKVEFNIKITSDTLIKDIFSDLQDKLKIYNISEINKKVQEKKVFYRFFLQFFNTGQISIPPITFNLITKDGKYKIYTNPLKITVLSNLNDNASFNDIKQPEKVGFYLTTKEFLILVIILLFLLFVYFAYRKLKKKKDKKYIRKLSPIEEFNINFKTCEKLLNEKKQKKFYFKLSESTRAYFDRIYNIHTLEATIKEIEQIFKKHNLDMSEDLKNKILSLYKKWDYYKFTGNFPTIQKSLEDLEEVKNIVLNIENLRKENEKKESKNV